MAIQIRLNRRCVGIGTLFALFGVGCFPSQSYDPAVPQAAYAPNVDPSAYPENSVAQTQPATAPQLPNETPSYQGQSAPPSTPPSDEMATPVAPPPSEGVQPFSSEQPSSAQQPVAPSVSDPSLANTPPIVTQNPEIEDHDPSALATFQPILAPYGTWHEDPNYGTVWAPSQAVVGADFSPYLTAGQWSYTNEGYYWNSHYQWGWLPFHYGRWAWSSAGGWIWIPGTRYAPAWVDWRYGNGYIGWGPMLPRYGWRNGLATAIAVGLTPFVFAPAHSLFAPRLNLVIAARAHAPSLIVSTSPWAAPSIVRGSVRPFWGPAPHVIGIPPRQLAQAAIVPRARVLPQSIRWQPAPNSRIAPWSSTLHSPQRVLPPSASISRPSTNLYRSQNGANSNVYLPRYTNSYPSNSTYPRSYSNTYIYRPNAQSMYGYPSRSRSLGTTSTYSTPTPSRSNIAPPHSYSVSRPSNVFPSYSSGIPHHAPSPPPVYRAPSAPPVYRAPSAPSYRSSSPSYSTSSSSNSYHTPSPPSRSYSSFRSSRGR